MSFIEYTNNWSKSEVTQARIMIGVGVLLLVAFWEIFKSQNELLRGTLIPMSLLLTVLLCYGSYILYSRPAHAKESIALYQQSAKEAIKKEQAKHINDNKSGKMLLRIYPFLMIVPILSLLIFPNPYYKGMAIGFVVFFLAAFIIDNGFVSRSESFLLFLSKLKN